MANSTTHLRTISSGQAQKEVTLNQIVDALSPAATYGRDATACVALTWGWFGGTVLIDGVPAQVANGTVQLTPSATSYLEADPADGSASVNTTGFTAGRKPLYQIVAGANTVASYTDLRVLGGGASAPVSSVNGQVGDVMLDAADVGAEMAGAAAAAVAAHAAAGDPHPQYLTQAEGDARYTAAGGGGTVTSVALTTPGLLFDISGSPITGAGTLAMTLKTQAANRFLAGPASGVDATPTMRALVAADLPAQPFDLTAFYPGIPPASAIVTRIPLARAVTFPAGLTGSFGKASVAAAAQADFDIQKNGVSVGTIRFAAGSDSATFIAASQVTFAAGDIASVLAPASSDATLASVGFVLAGTR